MQPISKGVMQFFHQILVPVSSHTYQDFSGIASRLPPVQGYILIKLHRLGRNCPGASHSSCSTSNVTVLSDGQNQASFT